jgi:acetyl-CoA synthetase
VAPIVDSLSGLAHVIVVGAWPARTGRLHVLDLSALRFAASVGEPLNPEAVVWGTRALGRPIHDNWWQTETGGIMIANFASMEIRPGSMGRQLPGIEASILARDPEGKVIVHDGQVTEIEKPGVEGELALRPSWPSMFRTYLHEEDCYARSFAGGWYLTGDVVRRDAEGYHWFLGRSDDVIKVGRASHRVIRG